MRLPSAATRGGPPVNDPKKRDRWYRVSGGSHLQLSAVDPPDARVPGPVIGRSSRVRPCTGKLPKSEFGVICLDVDIDGHIERGYTIRRMVSLTPEPRTSDTLFNRWLYLAIALLAILTALLSIGG